MEFKVLKNRASGNETMKFKSDGPVFWEEKTLHAKEFFIEIRLDPEFSQSQKEIIREFKRKTRYEIRWEYVSITPIAHAIDSCAMQFDGWYEMRLGVDCTDDVFEYALAHEARHIYQYQTGHLEHLKNEYGRSHGHIKWKGQIYTEYDMQTLPNRSYLPWERDANNYAKEHCGGYPKTELLKYNGRNFFECIIEIENTISGVRIDVP